MEITNFDQCTGCALCTFVCPVDAIHMSDGQAPGFWYPAVDEEKCICCNRCVSVCPTNNVVLQEPGEKKFVVAQETDFAALKRSTSGGAASALASEFIKSGGIAYGAAFGKDMRVTHIRCATEDDCKRIKGSKYVQSDITDTYSHIKKDLQRHTPVLFLGTPCQCAAMRQAFAQNKNFYCCDFICNGVGSPLIFEKHIQWLESQYRCKIGSYDFRPKTQKYLEPYEAFCDTAGKLYRLRAPWKKWGSLYYSALVLRSSCFACRYCKEERLGDITFADIPLILLQKDPIYAPYSILDHGGSLLSVNSDRGLELLQKLGNRVYLQEVGTQVMDRPKHIAQDMGEKEDFCLEAGTSLKKAKYKHLGWKLKLKSYIIEVVEKLKLL